MEDENILKLFWERQEDAITETDRKYGKMCSEISYNLLMNLQDAEECVNETYLGLWNSIPPQNPKVFSAYIAKLVRNISMKRITYLNAQKRNMYNTVSIHELEQTIPDCHSLEDHLTAEELGKSIAEYLSSLDYESRNIFLRRYWFFDSISEIAMRFCISESKVKSQLFRTRNQLHSFLVKEGLMNERNKAD